MAAFVGRLPRQDDNPRNQIDIFSRRRLYPNLKQLSREYAPIYIGLKAGRNHLGLIINPFTKEDVLEIDSDPISLESFKPGEEVFVHTIRGRKDKDYFFKIKPLIEYDDRLASMDPPQLLRNPLTNQIIYEGTIKKYRLPGGICNSCTISGGKTRKPRRRFKSSKRRKSVQGHRKKIV